MTPPRMRPTRTAFAALTLTASGGQVTFTYDHRSHVISDDAPRSVTGPFVYVDSQGA